MQYKVGDKAEVKRSPKSKRQDAYVNGITVTVDLETGSLGVLLLVDIDEEIFYVSAFLLAQWEEMAKR